MSQVRCALAPVDELAYIMASSRSSGLVVQDMEALEKLIPALSKVGHVHAGLANHWRCRTYACTCTLACMMGLLSNGLSWFKGRITRVSGCV